VAQTEPGNTPKTPAAFFTELRKARMSNSSSAVWRMLENAPDVFTTDVVSTMFHQLEHVESFFTVESSPSS
jgi:hypothetical protein